MFELSQLRCFVAVATELNFRRAAEQLCMTQPPLSRQIQLLEHQLGIVLLERNNRSVHLTAAGRVFFVEANGLLERARQAALSAQKIARGDIGAVSISFVASAVYGLLPRIIADLNQTHPGIDVSLKEMTTLEQVEALNSRRSDLGIVRSTPQQPGFSEECLVSEAFVLALPARHPLAARENVGVADLDGEPFIMYSYAGWRPFYELLSGAFRAARISPRFVQYVNSTLTMLSLVHAGIGLALVPESTRSLGLAGVVFRPIAMESSVRSDLHLLWKDGNDNPALPTVLELIRKYRIPAA